MPSLNFNAPEDFHERLKVYMDEHKIDNQSAFIRQAIEEAMNPVTLPAPAPPAPLTPNAAAEVILSLLPESQRFLILDIAKDKGRTPLDFILSYCRLAEERGETSSLIAEEVVQEEPVRYTTTLQQQSSEYVVCAFDGCRKSFIPTRRGQRFCPDPEDGTMSCGRKATLQETHKRRPQAALRRQSPQEMEAEMEARGPAPQFR